MNDAKESRIFQKKNSPENQPENRGQASRKPKFKDEKLDLLKKNFYYQKGNQVSEIRSKCKTISIQ